MIDLLITNGRVADGTGNPLRRTNVAISEGKVVGLGRFEEVAAERTIDAADRLIARSRTKTWTGVAETRGQSPEDTIATDRPPHLLSLPLQRHRGGQSAGGTEEAIDCSIRTGDRQRILVGSKVT